jgi:hypothetical protein
VLFVACLLPETLEPESLAEAARCILRAVVIQNRALLKRGTVPPLFKSGVRYREEPDAWARRGVEEFANALTVFKRGWGDCDDLAPYLVAEWQNAGDAKADTKIYWREQLLPSGEKFVHFHVEARDGTGRVWDPSRYLGM